MKLRALGLSVLVFLATLIASGGIIPMNVAAAGNTGTGPAGMMGSGTAASPFLVTNVTQLQAMRGNLSAHYALANDIDASNTSTWNGGKGFAPVGNASTPFTGAFDGQGHTISGLTIDRTGSYVGLFGNVMYGSGGTISNVTLVSVNVTSTGGQYTGGLVGFGMKPISSVSVSGTVASTGDVVGGLIGGAVFPVFNASANVTVTGGSRVGGLVGHAGLGVYGASANVIVNGTGDDVGGLVGYAEDVVKQASTTATVTGAGNHTGGLVGYASDSITNASADATVHSTGNGTGGLVGFSTGNVSDSFATGSVAATGVAGHDVGGLVGNNSAGTVSYSRTNATVTSNGSAIGGLVGRNDGTVSKTYATGRVNGTAGSSSVGGLVGSNTGAVSGSYWDTATTGQPASNGGTGLTTAEMIGTAARSNMSALFTPTYFQITWTTTDSYPRLQYKVGLTGNGTATDPYRIGTAGELQAMRGNLTAHYALANDIDASGTAGWNAGKGFDPIGAGSGFNGTFDGNGHVITDLTIARPGDENVGLFGQVESAGRVTNVTLLDVNVTGNNYMGGLVGANYGVVSNASANGTITGTGGDVGGLVGDNYGTISNAAVRGVVNGSGSYVGGMVGETLATVTNSTVDATVTGADYVGGLAGYSATPISNSSANGTVSGDGDIGGLVGSSYGSISRSSANTVVYGTGSSVGGLVGDNNAPISNSSASGFVNGTSSLGGLVGFNGGNVSNAWTNATVTGSGSRVGGLVGWNYGGNVTLAYASGEVSGSSLVGGLVGNNTTSGRITNAYWDVNATNQTISDGGTGLTTAQMSGSAARTNMTGFDFRITWRTTATYPKLNPIDTTPPTAIISANRTVVAPEGTVSFNATKSFDDIWVAGYSWNVTGGTLTTSTGPNTTATFTQGGPQTVTLTATDASENANSTTLTIFVDNILPNPRAHANRTVVRPGAPVMLDATNSTDNVGIDAYQWSVTNGTLSNATGNTTVASFTNAGTQTVTLTAVDTAANTNTTTFDVTVDGTPPTANLSANRTTVSLGQPIALDASGSTDNIGVGHYQWSAANASLTSTSGNTTTVSFNRAGTQTVTLTAADTAGNTNTTTLSVSVTDRTPPTITLVSPGEGRISEGTPVTVRVVDPSLRGGTVALSGPTDEAGQYAPPGETFTLSNITFSGTGQKVLIVNATDLYGNTNRSTFTFSIPSHHHHHESNPSSSSSSPTTGTSIVTEQHGNVSVRVEHAQKNQTVHVRLPKSNQTTSSGVGLESLDITAATQTNFQMSVSQSHSVTRRVSDGSPTLGEFHIQYDGTERSIENVTFGFTVKKATLAQENVSASSVALYRHHNGSWRELPTKLVSESGTADTFRAVSPGLSLYAVSRKGALSASQTTTTTTLTTRPTTTSTTTRTPTTTTVTRPSGTITTTGSATTSSKSPGFGVLTAFGALAALLAVLYSRHRREGR